MRIGVPREIKVHEYRVGLVPADREVAVPVAQRALEVVAAHARQSGR